MFYFAPTPEEYTSSAVINALIYHMQGLTVGCCYAKQYLWGIKSIFGHITRKKITSNLTWIDPGQLESLIGLWSGGR